MLHYLKKYQQQVSYNYVTLFNDVIEFRNDTFIIFLDCVAIGR